MKQLMMILVGLGLTVAVSAQPKLRGNVGTYGTRATVVQPRVTVVAPVYRYAPAFGYGMGLGYGYAPFRYSPFGDPFYSRSNSFERLPSELQLQIEEITNDYAYQISSVRSDKTLPRKERKQQIRELKHEREDAIIKAKRNYLRK